MRCNARSSLATEDEDAQAPKILHERSIRNSSLCNSSAKNRPSAKPKLAGWRIYITNASVERLPLPTAVVYYRDQWQLERGFHRFKRGNLPALPIYLQSEQRIIGLMFLLTIALRLFTLIEFVVQRQLQGQPQGLQGLYQGNPKRVTYRPSAERLLPAFCDITLYHYPDGTFDITPLNDLHKQILSLMAVPESVYDLTKISTRLTN